jgi:hypothetical protein
MRLPLKQRGINEMPEAYLKSYLDSINLNIMDQDLILLNQLAVIKSISNRQGFSLNQGQMDAIHYKFKNFVDQRHAWARTNPDYDQRGSMRPTAPAYVRHEISTAKKSNLHVPLPNDLKRIELEESREYRAAAIRGEHPRDYARPIYPEESFEFSA